MKVTKTRHMWIAIGLALFALGMVAGAVWDLSLNQAVYSPKLGIAIAMEAFGFYPLYLPALLWLALLSMAPKRVLWQRVLCGVIAGGGALGLCFYSAHELAKRPVTLPWLWICLVWLLLAAGFAVLFFTVQRQHSSRLRRKLTFAFFWGTVYMLLNNIVVTVFKLIWNRTRFDDMMNTGTLDKFTSWLRPFANGGNSFPSGHTAAACGIFVLVLLCDVLPAWNKNRPYVWGACWAYIAGMAICRIIIGRHYLSDTVMAAFLMTAVLLLLQNSKWYRQSLAAVRGVPAKHAPAENAAACARKPQQ